MNKRILNKAILLLCALMAALLSGCHIGNVSLGIGDYITGEEYPNAENYQTGTFTYNADEIKAVEVYWRSGEVEITEPDASELHVRESQGNFDVKKLHGIYRPMMELMVKTAGKSLAAKEDRTPEEDDMLDMMLHSGERVKFDNLRAVLDWYSAQK